MKEKVVLAYSGGLDTTAIIPWLKENYDYDVVCRELMLIKVKATSTTRSQIVQIADVYRGNVLDISPTSMIIEVIGSDDKLRGFVQIMETYGILEIAKTGITAMSRGEKM